MNNEASIIRRTAAMLYDLLLLLAFLFVATIPAVALMGGESVAANNPLLTTWLFFVSFFFYTWSWTRGGQTLGLKSWKMRLVRIDGKQITLWHCLLRFLAGIPSVLLGVGFLWMLWDKDNLTAYDRFSETMIIMVDDDT